MAGHRLVVEVEFDKEKFENMIDAFKATHPDLIEVVRCMDCVRNESCLVEDAFMAARIDNPYCCIGKRRTEDVRE